jgi:shikimate dehydrogenase
MAVGQAAESIRLITGRQPDRERMLAHFHELIETAERRAD